jgi:serine/threonine protein phosphatase PrpC
MKIYLDQPQSFHELGKRDNNEDCIFPKRNQATSKDTLFIVCDGVGGASKGEEASRIVCETLADCFNDPNDMADKAALIQAVTRAEKSMDGYLLDHPSARGMGTTMTFLQLHAQGATIAHAGDSRVYQIRNGSLKFKTEDHSLMNDLIRNGTLTVEQAQNHPQRNVITKAIQSSQRPIEPEVHVITDVQGGDYFFMCTDGVLEQLSDTLLCQTLADPNQTVVQKMATLKAICFGRTRDNFSAILVSVAAVDNPNPPTAMARNAKAPVDEAVTQRLPMPREPLVQDIPTSLSRPVAVVKTPVMPPAPVPAATIPFFKQKEFKIGLIVAVVFGVMGYFWQDLFPTKTAQPAIQQERPQNKLGNLAAPTNPVPVHPVETGKAANPAPKVIHPASTPTPLSPKHATPAAATGLKAAIGVKPVISGTPATDAKPANRETLATGAKTITATAETPATTEIPAKNTTETGETLTTGAKSTTRETPATGAKPNDAKPESKKEVPKEKTTKSSPTEIKQTGEPQNTTPKPPDQ